METEIENRVIGKVSRRLVWFVMLLYFFSILDRINVGFAALSMGEDLGLTAQMYGIGAGLAFFGLMFFETPSTMVLNHVRLRVWMARIVISWGIVATFSMFISNVNSFYWMRFLLGACEAGFFPGIVLYLGRWFPRAYRARFNAMFMLAIPVANAISSLISGAILEMDGLAGLAGWQWLFLLEGLPSIVLGVAAYFYLTERPSEASWLSQEERAWLTRKLEEERLNAGATPVRGSLKDVFRSPAVLALGVVFFCINVELGGVSFWMPQLIRSYGFSFYQTGLIGVLPMCIGALGMVLLSRRSDRRGERIGHLAAAMLLAAIGWGATSAFYVSPVIAICGVGLAAAGTYAALSIFWTLPATMLPTPMQAAGHAYISSIGMIGSAVSPAVVGRIIEAGHGFQGGYAAIAACALPAALGLWLYAGRQRARLDKAPQQ